MIEIPFRPHFREDLLAGKKTCTPSARRDSVNFKTGGMMSDKFIVGGDVTGNVGSCTSQRISAVSARPSWFKEEITTIVTNSCTGQVERYSTWEFTFGAFPLIVAATIVAVMLLDCIKTCWRGYR